MLLKSFSGIGKLLLFTIILSVVSNLRSILYNKNFIFI